MDITTYILSKKYVDDSLAGAGALVGKSAYQIAVDNGFKGTEWEWLQSLTGASPTIGDNGNWFINDTDTGVLASPSLVGYATEDFVNQQISQIPTIDLSSYATRQELSEALLGIKIPDVSQFITQKEVEELIAQITYPTPDLSNYATKVYVQELIETLNLPQESVNMIALTKEEILAICN